MQAQFTSPILNKVRMKQVKIMNLPECDKVLYCSGNGYIVVMAKYAHNDKSEEDYIDLVPILEDLYINPDFFFETYKKSY